METTKIEDLKKAKKAIEQNIANNRIISEFIGKYFPLCDISAVEVASNQYSNGMQTILDMINKQIMRLN